MEFLPYIVIALIGLALSAFYSGAETGLYTINRVRMTVRAATGDPAAVRLRTILSNPTRMLAMLLIANNIANYAGTWGVAAILDRMGFSPGAAIVLNAAVLIPLLFIFGEVLPKDLFRTHTDGWSYHCSLPLQWTQTILTWVGLSPIVQGFGRLLGRLLGDDEAARRSVRQRISILFKEGLGAGVISEAQATLADRAIALRDLTVRTEAIPWTRVKALPLAATYAQRARLLSSTQVSRFPVVDESGRVVGVLRKMDCALNPTTPTAEMMTDPLWFKPETPVRDALAELRHVPQRMAMVGHSPQHPPLGIVTLKDLVEPLVGELGAW